jgi:hypothetical protein
MKHVNLVEQPVDINHVLELAHEGPVVIIAADGKEYIITEANDFDQEVEQLRNSATFQQFLDERSAKNKPRRSLTEVAQAIEAEIATTTTEE